tara:strand:+ start:476 stop:1135 length:660 start_codon:yes stop_codon:yes gene_type:complete
MSRSYFPPYLPARPPLLLAFEGIPGSGKTVQLDMIREKLPRDDVIFLHRLEEQAMSQSLIDNEISALAFHTSTLALMFASLVKAIGQNPFAIVSEGSVFSAAGALARLHLHNTDFKTYELVFRHLRDSLPPLRVVLLHMVSPVDVAFTRLIARDPETQVSMEYLNRLRGVYSCLDRHLPPEGESVEVDSAGCRETTAATVWEVVLRVLRRTLFDYKFAV